MEYKNNHVNEFKKAFSTISKIQKEIASSVELESTRFEKFVDDLRMGDEISWVELDGKEYGGTVISYLNGGTPNSGVRIVMEYGTADMTVNKASIIANAWKVE